MLKITLSYNMLKIKDLFVDSNIVLVDQKETEDMEKGRELMK